MDRFFQKWTKKWTEAGFREKQSLRTAIQSHPQAQKSGADNGNRRSRGIFLSILEYRILRIKSPFFAKIQETDFLCFTQLFVSLADK